MLNHILIDTSVLIDAIQQNKTRETEILYELDALNEEYGIPALCAQELLQGALNKREWNKLWNYLGDYDLVVSEDPVSFHVKSAEIYYQCLRKGYPGNNTVNCMIAQLAIENGASILTSNKGFQKIKQVSSLKTL